MDMMGQFMCHDGFDLLRSELRKKRVPEDDTAGASQSNQCGVGGSSSTAHIEGEDALHMGPGGLSQES